MSDMYLGTLSQLTTAQLHPLGISDANVRLRQHHACVRMSTPLHLARRQADHGRDPASVPGLDFSGCHRPGLWRRGGREHAGSTESHGEADVEFIATVPLVF